MNNFKQKTEEEKLSESINEFWEGGLSQISDLHKVPNEIGLEVLKIILSTACHRQNATPIELANEVIREVDREWLGKNMITAAEEIVCFEDDWDYRRLLEMIYRNVPQLLEWGISKGIDSEDENIIDVVEDFEDCLIEYKSKNS